MRRTRPVRRWLGVAATALTAVAILMGSALPASAAYWRYSSQGSDYARYDLDTDTLEVCDMERDGHRVYVEYYRSNGSYGYFYDGNGSKPGCTGRYVNLRYNGKFRVCEEVWGPDWCPAWKYPWAW